MSGEVEADYPDAVTTLVTGRLCLLLLQVRPAEQEISLLKSQAENIKKELDIVESRICDLQSRK